MKRWQKLSLAAAGGLAVVIAGAELVGHRAVDGKVRALAERHHAKIVVDKTHVGLFGGRLEGVRITLDDVPGFALQANAIDVQTSATLQPTRVTLAGGRVDVPDLEGLRAALANRATESGGAATDSTGPELRIVDLAFAVKSREQGSVTGTSLSVTRTSDAIDVKVGTANAVRENLSLDVTALAVSATRALEVRSVQADTVKVGTSTEAQPSASTSPFALGADLDPRARLRALEETLRAHTATLCRVLPATVPFGTQHLSFEPKSGLRVGQGPFALSKVDNAVTLAFSSEAREGTTPLKLRVTTPCAPDEDVVVHLEGGPVPLALVGIREGTFGLVDVDKATVRGEGDVRLAKNATSIDASVTLEHVGVNEPKLAKESIHDLRLSAVARAVVTGGQAWRLDDIDVGIGAAHLKVRGMLTSDPAVQKTGSALAPWSANVNFDVPSVACDDMLASVPAGLKPVLEGAKMSGTFGARGALRFVGTKLDDMVLDYAIQNDCRMVAVPPALEKRRFDGKFQHIVYRPDGTKAEETTGPGTDHWTPFEHISPFMQAAVLTTEDGGFRHHRGFSHDAIKRALINNLKAGKFLQGASTISMQLAKNLFLTREKTLSRKFEEIVLTDYLEQVFDKDTMMELYLNIIEFGPNLYGIGRAAQHYFGRTPGELNLPECMFLATLLPSPVKLSHLGERAEISPGWQSHLERLMRTSHKTGKITASELSDGLANSHLLFFHAGGPKPSPRAPARGSRLEGNDAEWVPIDAP
jgi:hypothetical protein